MSVITGCIQTKSGSSLHERALQLAQQSARTESLTTRRLIGTENISLHVGERSNSLAQQFSAKNQEGHSVWLVGDVNYIDQEYVSTMTKQILASAENLRVPGRWMLIKHDPAQDRMEIQNDPWGLLWLYIARVPEGYLLSSDYGALARQLEGYLTIDEEACVLELVLGYSTGNRTVFKEITLAPPGSLLSFTDTEMTATTTLAPQYADTYARSTDRTKYARLDELWALTHERYFKPYSHNLTVSISAGMDSRHALAILQQHNVAAEYLTFGDPDSSEVQTSKLNCGRVRIANRVFNFSQADWEEWRSCVSQLGNSGIVQMAGWADQWHQFVKTFGPSMATGIFGGPLTGTHLKQVGSGNEDWIENWINFSTPREWFNGSGLLRHDRCKWFDKNIYDIFTYETENIAFSMPHQRGIHLDYMFRQRRWTAAQPELTSRYVTPLPYLYSPEFIGFWSSLDLKSLSAQTLYLSYARSRFPDLFRSWERRPGGFWRLIRLLRGKALSQGSTGKGRHQMVINHRRILVQNEHSIRALVNSVRDAADSIVDCDEFLRQLTMVVNGHAHNGQQLIRCVNLFILLSLRN